MRWSAAPASCTTHAVTPRCSWRCRPTVRRATRSTKRTRCCGRCVRAATPACRGPTAAQAQFRTGSGTWARVAGLLLIVAGVLGMLLLLGFVALRLLGAGFVQPVVSAAGARRGAGPRVGRERTRGVPHMVDSPARGGRGEAHVLVPAGCPTRGRRRSRRSGHARLVDPVVADVLVLVGRIHTSPPGLGLAEGPRVGHERSLGPRSIAGKVREGARYAARRDRRRAAVRKPCWRDPRRTSSVGTSVRGPEQLAPASSPTHRSHGASSVNNRTRARRGRLAPETQAGLAGMRSQLRVFRGLAGRRPPPGTRVKRRGSARVSGASPRASRVKKTRSHAPVARSPTLTAPSAGRTAAHS